MFFFCFGSLFCVVILSVLYSFSSHLVSEKLVPLLQLCSCFRAAVCVRGATVWAVVCDCGISWSCLLAF